MYSQVILVSLLAAVAQARFGQEQVPIPAIAAVKGGSPGEAPTIAGAAVSDLLAAANPCVKLKRGDQILAELGTGADSIAAAKGIVAAEQNFNPFTFSNPAICTDPSLPANPILRGIVPLIDPAVNGSAAVNALSKKTLTTPLNADGKSIADLLKENGFTDFRGIANDGSGPVVSGDPVAASSTTKVAAPPAAVSTTAVQNAAKPTATDSGAVDYGLCNPNMDFVAGRPGRKPDESTFLPIDPLTKQGQQDALNPNIITNRICDQLTNVCQSNQAAKDRCRSCQAQIQALGTRDASTAVAWNDCVDNGVQIVSVAVTDTPASSAAPPAVSSVVNVVAASSEAGCTITQVISTVTVTVNGGATNVAIATPAPVSNSNSNSNTGSGSNVQTFTGDLGAPPVPVQNVGGSRPFVVKGDSFVNFSAACQRSCAVQNNACANAANADGNKSFSVGDCNAQEDECDKGCSNSAAARREKRFIRVYRKRA